MREKILYTALDQFLKYGIREVSIVKLAKTLIIATKTIYKFYENKEQILEEVLQVYYDEKCKRIQEMSMDQLASVAFFEIWRTGILTQFHVNRTFYKDLKCFYPDLAIKLETTIKLKFDNMLLQVVQNAIDNGSFHSDLNSKLVYHSTFVLDEAISRSSKFSNENSHYDALMKNTILIYIEGLCTNKGSLELANHKKDLLYETQINKGNIRSLKNP
jgi:AcrR family transcriptional regulator